MIFHSLILWHTLFRLEILMMINNPPDWLTGFYRIFLFPTVGIIDFYDVPFGKNRVQLEKKQENPTAGTHFVGLLTEMVYMDRKAEVSLDMANYIIFNKGRFFQLIMVQKLASFQFQFIISILN